MRTDWTFEFDGEAVGLAAAEKARYHRERAAYWDNEVAVAENAIRTGGIDIRGYDHTGGRRNEVVIDPNLADRLAEAQSKRDSHLRRSTEFTDWAAVLRLDPRKTFELRFDDVLYFGLAPAATLMA